jgi:hypothetical protein
LPPGTFPFSIVFTIRADGVIFIVAVAHSKRRPGYWSLADAIAATDAAPWPIMPVSAEDDDVYDLTARAQTRRWTAPRPA